MHPALPLVPADSAKEAGTLPGPNFQYHVSVFLHKLVYWIMRLEQPAALSDSPPTPSPRPPPLLPHPPLRPPSLSGYI